MANAGTVLKFYLLFVRLNIFISQDMCNVIKVIALDNLSDHSIFFGLHIAGGFVGLPLLIITLLVFENVPRQPVLINFCLTCILFSISSTLT